MLYSLCRDGGIILVSFVAARSDFEHFAFCFGRDRKFFDHPHFGQEQEPQMSVCAFYIQARHFNYFYCGCLFDYFQSFYDKSDRLLGASAGDDFRLLEQIELGAERRIVLY